MSIGGAMESWVPLRLLKMVREDVEFSGCLRALRIPRQDQYEISGR